MLTVSNQRLGVVCRPMSVDLISTGRQTELKVVIRVRPAITYLRGNKSVQELEKNSTEQPPEPTFSLPASLSLLAVLAVSSNTCLTCGCGAGSGYSAEKRGKCVIILGLIIFYKCNDISVSCPNDIHDITEHLHLVCVKVQITPTVRD